MRESQSEHWYAPDGSPVYTIIGNNGKERPTTLRDARKHGYVPSVTGIIRCADAAGLNYYRQQQVLMAALTLPRRPHEPEQSWIDRVWIDSREHAKKAAERGTAIHDAVERFAAKQEYDLNYADHLIGVNNILMENDCGQLMSLVAEQSFYHPLGFGGKCDLHSEDCVIDMKTKEFDDPAKLSTYDEHHMQLAAYREGLKLPQARCAILYISVTVPGLAKLMWIDTKDLLRGWSMFKALLAYWQSKNKYFPAVKMEETA